MVSLGGQPEEMAGPFFLLIVIDQRFDELKTQFLQTALLDYVVDVGMHLDRLYRKLIKDIHNEKFLDLGAVSLASFFGDCHFQCHGDGILSA